jgi:Phage tail tube protein, GTA-gp10
MANIMRGETSLVIAGQRRALALTLGALAELEDALGPDGLSGLAERLADGRLSAGDALAVLAAGLAGAGTPIGRYELGRLIPAAELGHARQTAADLLAASFGGGSPSRPPPPQAAA